MKYNVIVGNIGYVRINVTKREAIKIFDKYVEQSKNNYGRASGENVTITESNSGEPIKEYFGNNDFDENPRPRVGTRKPLRRSSTTGKRPTKRLIKRRRRDSVKGYFPNPDIHVDINSHNQRALTPGAARRLQAKVYQNPQRKIAPRKHEPRGKIWVRSNRNIRRIAHRQIKYGSPYHYMVQVDRGGKWVTLGGFTVKDNAVTYGKSLAAKFRSKKFRVAWK